MYRASAGVVGIGNSTTATPGGSLAAYNNIQSKTANYTAVLADTGAHFDNTGATGPVTITVPTPTKGWNACFTTTVAQNLIVTTPSGAIIGSSFTTGATRTVTAQLTTFCIVDHDSTNHMIESLFGSIAS